MQYQTLFEGVSYIRGKQYLPSKFSCAESSIRDAERDNPWNIFLFFYHVIYSYTEQCDINLTLITNIHSSHKMQWSH